MRPPVQRRLVYALNHRGATLLAEFHGATAPKVDWTVKIRTARRL
jgi:hypothetical protein